MIKIIAAMGLDRSMGLNGKKAELPWKSGQFKGDLKRFKELTRGSVVIMGRRTWDSLGRTALDDRVNYVIATKTVHAASQEVGPYGICKTLREAVEHAQEHHPDKDIVFIGGSKIFKEGQRFAQEIDITLLPFKGYEAHSTDDLVYFPEVDQKIFKKRSSFTHPNNPELRILKYRR